jgi:hypothetical protein
LTIGVEHEPLPVLVKFAARQSWYEIFEAPATSVKFDVLVGALSLNASAGVVPDEHEYWSVPVAVPSPDVPALIVPNVKLPAPPVLVIEQFPCTVSETLSAAVAEPALATAGVLAASAASARQEIKRVMNALPHALAC